MITFQHIEVGSGIMRKLNDTSENVGDNQTIVGSENILIGKAIRYTLSILFLTRCIY